ncbi:terpene cyclase/mutase family protein [Streptomyces sp. b94]|uniref:prenyltransferase/squalene oxidase repeat-containing protein n=1 Tax=Streptomyces sp. b94 TaxID=1827634 RepID=UPI001B37E9DE|nr:prenyltransferase/squalene oxidase repeat-containing protein [Streptomyces sp. b94]MBQ1096188.1 terpene cyclase/mutase family protein [Streptomyces sp. b94]
MRPAPSARNLPRWPSEAFPVDLAPATARLRTHLQRRMHPDGAVRDPCRSRVLESALLLALLDRSSVELPARDRLAVFLAAHRDSPEPLDRLLARTALHGRRPETDQLDVDRFLARAPHFTGPRKRALLHAILLLLEGTNAAPPPLCAPEAFSPHGLHSWARVQTTAAKVVLARVHHQLVDERDLELLRSTQHPGVVWEGNLLIHLSVLHALAPLPGHQQLMSDGIRTALAHQRADGGVPFICDEDTWLTANAGVALHTTGAAASVVDAIARRLLRLQRRQGGWSYTEQARLTDADCTSVAAEHLHLAGPGTHRAAIRRAISALGALRGQDGGYPTYSTGAPSEPSMTAAAANALSTQGHRQRPALDAALKFLSDQQHPDGSFPPDWSSSRLHTVFRATLAAAHHPGAPGGVAQRISGRAVRLVMDSQNNDGGWGQQDSAPSDALSTSYALITLSAGYHAPTPGPAVRGAAYLLAQRRHDGSIASIPDSVGPRPFRFTVPALADVFALLALGHLTHRLAPVPEPSGRPWDGTKRYS